MFASTTQVGLIQALGGRKAVCSCVGCNCDSSASAGIALRTGSRHVCSSVKSVWRAHTSHALRLPAPVAMIGLRSVCTLQILSLRLRPAQSSQGALRRLGFGFRQVRQDSICIGFHRHLTIRSSRPHVVASAMCFALRLHMSATPPRGGLTQALGGKEHSAVALSVLQLFGFGQHCSSDGFSTRLLFGQVHLARSYFACVTFAGFGDNGGLAVGLYAPDAVASVTAG